MPNGPTMPTVKTNAFIHVTGPAFSAGLQNHADEALSSPHTHVLHVGNVSVFMRGGDSEAINTLVHSALLIYLGRESQPGDEDGPEEIDALMEEALTIGSLTL